MVKLVDNIISLSFFIGRLILEHLKVILIALLLLSNFLFVVLDCGIIALLSSLTLLLETSLQTITLYLKEALKLL
jgi:hypothetical protein